LVLASGSKDNDIILWDVVVEKLDSFVFVAIASGLFLLFHSNAM
jgi:hypothetical protein